MISIEVEKLILSMSGAERKYFHLHATQLQGSKDYLLLYEMALSRNNRAQKSWEERFKEKYPEKSFDNTANYLYKIITDVLVQIRIEQDTWFMQYQCLMKARVCFERSITGRANKELQKAKKLATGNQNHLVKYQAMRMELTELSDNKFPNTSEQQLIDMQMKAKHTLQSLRQLHEHYSLYELLSHRMTQGSLKRQEKQDKKINDLILSELSLSTRGSHDQFEPQKLHLLFQSFFFIHTGEYRSALRIFNELNTFIAANETMWDYPPYDYLSALDGILDSLRSIGYYEEMDKFIKKIQLLAERSYPEHFKSLAQLTADVYLLNRSVGTNDLEKAFTWIETFKNDRSHTITTQIHEKTLEIVFFTSLAYFLKQEWNIAQKYIHQLLGNTNQQTSSLSVYRAIRLLQILIAYERNDLSYLEYEIRSYKRMFSKFGKAYKSEKLIFNTITTEPRRRGNAWKATAWKKIGGRISEILSEKNEIQLLKFYNFCEWVKIQYK